MAERATLFQVVQVGVETTPGTAVAASRRFQSISIEPSIQAEINTFRAMGNKFAGLASVGKEWVEADVSGQPTYDEAVYLFASVIGAATITNIGTGAYKWVFSPRTNAADAPATYTIEQGSVGGRAHRFTSGLVTALGLNWSRDNIEISGSLLGKRLEDDVQLSTNEVQTLSMTGSPTGGTFTLTFSGQTTTPGIAYNASASAVQTALEGLSNINPGDVVCAGGPLPGTAVTIEFRGQYAQSNVAEMTANSTSLTGGTTPTAAVATTTAGAAPTLLSLTPVLPTHVTVYLADAQTDLDAADAAERILSVDWSLEDRFGPVWELNAAQDSWVNFVETEPSLTATVMAQANAAGMAWLNTMRTGATRFMRIEAEGGEIASSGQNYLLRLDMAVKVSDVGNFSDEDGVYAVEWTLTGVTDSVWGKVIEVTVQNGLSAL